MKGFDQHGPVNTDHLHPARESITWSRDANHRCVTNHVTHRKLCHTHHVTLITSHSSRQIHHVTLTTQAMSHSHKLLNLNSVTSLLQLVDRVSVTSQQLVNLESVIRDVKFGVQIRSDWPKLGLFKISFSKFLRPAMILKSPIFVPLGTILTQFRANVNSPGPSS